MKMYFKFGFFCKIDPKLKVNHKINLWFFWKFHFSYSPHKFKLFTKMPLIFFLSKMSFFTLSTSSSSRIYKIASAINTPTTMNNQFEVLNAPKINLHFLFSQFLWTNKNNISLLSLHIHPKKPRFWFKFFYGS